MAESAVRLAFMTAPDGSTAERLARALVEEGVVACVNIVPGLTSIYRWEGAIECESEVLMVMKTTAGEVARLLERAPALHPYEVPEVLVLDVDAGHAAYLDWVARSVGEIEAAD
jgi:periplasmic divalent cation tolerance protein